MADHGLEIQETFNPTTSEIDFLTERINEESRYQNISEDAYPFAIFLKKCITTSSSVLPAASSEQVGKDEETLKSLIVGGCNGSVVYGSIYTDQLWLHSDWRGKGLGKMLMEKVHDLGRRQGCSLATVGTMSFQGAQKFYESLGYEVEFVREGYAKGGKMIYLKKAL